MEIRALRESDSRSVFSSGDPDLDRFFLKYAGQIQFRHHIGATYVAAEGERMAGRAAKITRGQRLAPGLNFRRQSVYRTVQVRLTQFGDSLPEQHPVLRRQPQPEHDQRPGRDQGHKQEQEQQASRENRPPCVLQLEHARGF